VTKTIHVASAMIHLFAVAISGPSFFSPQALIPVKSKCEGLSALAVRPHLTTLRAAVGVPLWKCSRHTRIDFLFC